MKILLITGDLPAPPTNGQRIRVFSLLKSLSARNGVSLVSFVRNGPEPAALEMLHPHCERIEVVPRAPRYKARNLLRGLLPGAPFSVLNYRDARMSRLVRRLESEEDFEVIHAEGVQLAQYAEGLRGARILGLQNVESDLLRSYARHEENPLRRWYALDAARKLENYERRVYPRFQRILTCSEADRGRVAPWAGGAGLELVPNGVDASSFAPPPGGERSDRVVFVGRMDYHANVDAVHWFEREVWPRVLRRLPGATLQIVGGPVAESVSRLARSGSVEVTGFVEDVRPFLGGAGVVVAPIRVGGGTRLKILEALAMEKAVVSTAAGAEGLAVSSGKHLWLADGAGPFADAVLGLAENPSLRRELGSAGRRLVVENYAWEAIGRRLEEIYLGCLHRAPLLSQKSAEPFAPAAARFER